MTYDYPTIRPTYLRKVAAELHGSEEAVLAALLSMRVATADQIARSVFVNADPKTAQRLAHRFLRRLATKKLVRRFPNTAPVLKPGPRGSVYVLTAGGERLVTPLHRPVKPQRKAWQPSASKLAHWLAIGEIYTRLVEQARTGGPKVSKFLTEGAAKRTFADAGGRRRFLRPDALVRLIAEDMEISWFLEIDRGTEGLAVIDRKCRAYRDYDISGYEHARYGVFPAVLFIAPDKHRANNIARVIAAQPADSRNIFAVTTEADAIPKITSTEL